jgi:hypothetical protein
MKLNELTEKLASLKGIIERNRWQCENETGSLGEEEAIRFPFILVATEDEEQNSLTINLSPDFSEMKLNFAKECKLVGDIDLLNYLSFKKRRD